MERGPKLASTTEGPHKILNTYKNGAVKIQRGNYETNLKRTSLKTVQELRLISENEKKREKTPFNEVNFKPLNHGGAWHSHKWPVYYLAL